jgi:hypothetical protein
LRQTVCRVRDQADFAELPCLYCEVKNFAMDGASRGRPSPDSLAGTAAWEGCGQSVSDLDTPLLVREPASDDLLKQTRLECGRRERARRQVVLSLQNRVVLGPKAQDTIEVKEERGWWHGGGYAA